jgi:hypothetical protein
MNLDDFKDCVVVVAHPDDEILWASSILASAKKIVLCYGDTPGSAQLGEGRRALVRDFPLKTVVALDIMEPATYLTANWKRPVETAHGLHCGRNREAYARSFREITEALREHIADGDLVVTHNPWGEYGHEEHVQVFRAVAGLKRERDFRLFVTGYVSDRALYFMEKNTPRLGVPSALMPTDKALGERLKRHYQAHGCWTFEDAYEWPDYECFYEVADPDAPLRANEKTMASLPVNVLWYDGQLPAWRRAYRVLKRVLSTFSDRLSRSS